MPAIASAGSGLGSQPHAPTAVQASGGRPAELPMPCCPTGRSDGCTTALLNRWGAQCGSSNQSGDDLAAHVAGASRSSSIGGLVHLPASPRHPACLGGARLDGRAASQPCYESSGDGPPTWARSSRRRISTRRQQRQSPSKRARVPTGARAAPSSRCGRRTANRRPLTLPSFCRLLRLALL